METLDQFQLLDVDVTWEATTPDPGHNFYFEPQGPEVWGSAFADADLYQRLQIDGKPSEQLLEGWLCLWNPRWEREVCTYAADAQQDRWPVFRFGGDGVYYTRWPRIDTWPGAHGKHAMRFDPQQPVTHVLIQLFGVFPDPGGQFRNSGDRYHIRKLRQDHWTDNDDLRRHLPFRMRSQVHVVRRERRLRLPEGWQDAPAAWAGG